MLTQTDIQNTIRAWALLIFPTTTIVFRESLTPSGTRPDLPYIGLKFMSIQAVLSNHQTAPDINEVAVITGTREIIFSAQYYGNNAKTELEKFTLFCKDNVNITYLLKNGGISYIQNLGIHDISTLRDTIYEQRANIDMAFRIGSQVEIDAPIVETVGINGELKDQENNVLKEINISNI